MNIRIHVLIGERLKVQFKTIPIFAALAVLLCTTFILANHPANDISIEAEGYGSSKKDALLQARKGAVENGMEALLTSKTEINNFQLLKDDVLNHGVGLVKNYKILHQEKRSNNTYHVKIQATVSLDNIKANLVAHKILLESMDKPRLMVFIQEKNGRTAQNAIVGYLKAKQFNLVIPESVPVVSVTGNKPKQQSASIDTAAATTMGAKNGAEYIIVGTVNKAIGSGELLKNAGLISGLADIRAEIIDCSSGRTIISKSVHCAAAHISEETAMNAAAEKAGYELMDNALFETIVHSFKNKLKKRTSLSAFGVDVEQATINRN